MNSLELKNILIHRISEINDIAFLKALKTILDSKADSKIIQLTPEQRDEIIESKKDIEKGLFIENEMIDKDFDKWASAK